MKYTIETQEKEFEPIALTITIESLAELKSFLARMNQGARFDDGGNPNFVGAYMDTYELWNELNKLLQKRS
jgi:UTP-glucose-1-phosphate uridylyltransferase